MTKYRLLRSSGDRSFATCCASICSIGDLALADALRLVASAEADLEGHTYDVPSADVLRLVEATGHSAYDCEYVALARQLDVPLVTGDRQVVEQFPETAVLLDDYASGSVEDG